VARAPLNETRVADHVWVYSTGGETILDSYGTNCTAVFGREGVLLVDPLIAPAEARRVEAAVRARTSLPIRFVVVTHHHTDHALGASWFARQGVPIVAHRACREGMAAEHPDLIAERRRLPALRAMFQEAELCLPAITFKSAVELDLGGFEVMVSSPGPGHTAGDCVVLLVEDEIAIAGDLVSVGYHFNYEHASLPNLRRGLEALSEFAPRVLVPGHGRVSGRAAIADQGGYHVRVERIVQQGIASGASDEEIGRAIREGFAGYRLELVVPDTVARFRGYLTPR
jgi:cyclase